MLVQLVDCQYTPAEPATFKQGVKNHRIPKHAISGGNGSFIVSGAPNRADITVKPVGSGRAFDFDIRRQLKDTISGRLTEKRILTAFDKLSLAPFDITQNAYGYWEIVDLDQILQR